MSELIRGPKIPEDINSFILSNGFIKTEDQGYYWKETPVYNYILRLCHSTFIEGYSVNLQYHLVGKMYKEDFKTLIDSLIIKNEQDLDFIFSRCAQYYITRHHKPVKSLNIF